jgi:hypothetical protein
MTKTEISELMTRHDSKSVIEKATLLLRTKNMIEHIEEPTPEEAVGVIEQAVYVLNSSEPVTNLDYNALISTPQGEALLVRAVQCELLKVIVSDYTHRSIAEHSIEDIQVKDRKGDYEALLSLCEYEKVLEDMALWKRANGLGIEGVKARGTVRRVPRIENDFNQISNFGRGTSTIKNISIKVWGRT